jgi:hypothetical protein
VAAGPPERWRLATAVGRLAAGRKSDAYRGSYYILDA